MNRTLAVFLAFLMFVPSIVPVAAQDPGEPEPPELPEPPEEPQPPEEPEPPQEPEPPEQPPEPPGQPPEPPEDTPELPDNVHFIDPQNSSSPRTTYFEENFTDLDDWARVQLDGDRVEDGLWSIGSLGGNNSSAAILSGPEGLPSGMHQGLASPTVDLTPVPGRANDPTVTSATQAGLDRSNNAAQEGVRSSIAIPSSTFKGLKPGEQLTRSPLLETGPLTLPEGPATLSLIHQFNFDDSRNEQDEAVSGFTVEARSAEDGDWVPVEAAMAARPVYDAATPGPSQQTEDLSVGRIVDDENLQVNSCATVRGTADLVSTIGAGFGGFLGQLLPDPETVLGFTPVECNLDAISLSISPDAENTMYAIGDTTFEISTGETNNESSPNDEGVPVNPNAYIQPLDQRGYTGDSDTNGDGELETVGHLFDLTPWAGEEVELRLRAGTSPVTDIPEGFWGIEHLSVKAAARTADLRLDLTAPRLDHAAPNDEPFPIKAEVQNVGFTAQEGPFDVNITILREGSEVANEIVRAEAESLEFLETTSAQLDFIALQGSPFTVEAELVPGHADEDARNNADADILPVRVDESVDLEVLPEASVAEPGEVTTATVIATSQANVPVHEELTLTAFPYDPATQLPMGEGSVVLDKVPIHLPPSADKHPQGIENAVQSATFTVPPLPEGAYLLVAELSTATGNAPLGVGTPPPPVITEDFASFTPGPASFAFDTGSGTWEAHPAGDVQPVPRKLGPGSIENGAAWVPLQHESTLIQPRDNRHASDSDASTPAEVDNCPPAPGNPCDTFDGSAFVGSPLVLESPRGTQRVHAMATEVGLHDAAQAELSFLSAMVPAQDSSGISEARVYVATDADEEALLSDLTDPENCPRDRPCQIVNEQAGLLAVDETAFLLERFIRCNLPDALGQEVEAFTGVGGTGGTMKDLACPSRGEETSIGTDNCQATPCDVKAASPRTSDLAAIAPMLSGTLVHRDVTTHTWEDNTVDLSRWAGQNVTLGFVFLTESQEAMLNFDARPYGSAPQWNTYHQHTDVLTGKLGFAPPGQARDAFMASRISVSSDAGPKLDPQPDHVHPAPPQNTAQEVRPGHATTGWDTIGYDYLEDLGDPERPLRTTAQLLYGTGRAGAEGADTTRGLELGHTEDGDTGVRLYPLSLHGDASKISDQAPSDFIDTSRDPAVTIVKSPRIDLSGTDAPIVRFDQRFDLTTDNGPQPLIKPAKESTITSALEIPDELDLEEDCNFGKRNSLGSGKQAITLEGIRCLLEEKRQRDGDFNVQNKVLNELVAEPQVSAGMFVQARTVEDDGLSAPKLVEPVEGYRYPIDDAGGFEPTLDYSVESPDAFPGYTTGQEPAVEQDSALWNQPTLVESFTPPFAGTPAWAGDSDTSDEGGDPDWVTSTLDLTAFAGEEVQLEFVLVARNNESTNDPDDPQQDGTKLTKEPWSIDRFEIVESDVEGEVRLEEMLWPNNDLPVITEGEDLPVRLTVSTPTGLDDPIHAKALLVDGDGCVRGTQTTSAQFQNEAGRAEPMPAGATLELPEMVIDGADVDGASPWTLKAGVDVATTPSLLSPSSVEMESIPNQADRTFDATGALNVTENTHLNMTIKDPDCDADTDVLSVRAHGLQPTIEKTTESDEVRLHLDANEEAECDANADDDDKEGRLRGDLFHAFECEPMLISATEGSDGTAGGRSMLVHDRAEEATAKVEASTDRVPVQGPIEVTVDVPRDLPDAILWSVDPTESSPDPEQLWRGSLSSVAEFTLPVSFEETGPHLILLTGITDDNEKSLGGTLVVASDAKAAGDPTRNDNTAQLTAIGGERMALDVVDVDVTPASALSTTPRTITARVQNTGTIALSDVQIEFSAGGDLIDTRSREQMRAGEVATFTLPNYSPGDNPSIVFRVDADSAEGPSSSASAPIRSLVHVRSLDPSLTEDSDGWQINGDTASFRDPDTEKAPRDTLGTIDLDGAQMEGLAGVAVELDHSLDMEEAFDGGQITLSSRTDTNVLTAGPATDEMGPYSPIGGKALTGTRTASDDQVELDAQRFLGEGSLEVLKAVTAIEEIGYPALTDDVDDEPEDMGKASFANCVSRTFADEQVALETEGGYCEHADSILPMSEVELTNGVWYMPPASFLSTEDAWTVEGHEVSVEEVTNYVFLEWGREAVEAAQEEGKLQISFDEARQLRPISDISTRPLSVEVCARFMHVDERSGGTYALAPSAGPPTVRRCTGLTHDEVDRQTLNKPWSRTSLTIGNIPDDALHGGEYNLVRIELSLREDRSSGSSPGLLGNGQRGGEALDLQRPIKGWFVGPVSLQAAGFQDTRDPDGTALSTTDPTTGLSSSEFANEVQKGQHGAPDVRHEEIVDQFGIISIDRATVDGETIETTRKIEASENPTFRLPLTPCQWYRVDDCAWSEFVDNYKTVGMLSERPKLVSSAPYALNLTCTLPSVLNEDDIDATHGCETRGAEPGMGPQVLDKKVLDKGDAGACRDVGVGHPTLWRTHCLHATRASDRDTLEDGFRLNDNSVQADDDGESIRFTTSEMASEDPMRQRGHSIDARFVVPADLRFAASNVGAWAQPFFENLGEGRGTGNNDLTLRYRAEARLAGEDRWEPVTVCPSQNPQATGCSDHWGSLKDDDYLDLSDYVGQEVEISLRVQIPHPTLNEDSANTGLEPSFAFHGLRIEAGYLRMIDLDMQMRAWTDTSIEGEGWDVEGVELFGLPIKSNVGIHEFESKALVEDWPTDKLHVHLRQSADRDLFMSVPANLTVYNQASSTSEDIPLEATLQAEQSRSGWIDSTSDDWTDSPDIDAPGKCKVEIQHEDISLRPGSSERVPIRLNFIPVSEDDRLDPEGDEIDLKKLEECFPEQIDDEGEVDNNRIDFRVKIDITDVPEDDYVSSDNHFIQELRPNPFADHGDFGVNPHEPSLKVENFTIAPTRPAPDQPVRVSANVSLVDETERRAGLDLSFIDPASDETLRRLKATNADTPVTAFQPYETAQVNWTLIEAPAGTTLVDLEAEIERDGDPVVRRTHGWLANGSIHDSVERFSAGFLDDFQTSGDMGRHDEASGSWYTTDEGQENDGERAAILGTEWMNLENSAPPVIAVNARWNFDGTDQGNAPERDVADGWAIQLCHTRERDNNDCPLNTNQNGHSSTGDWAWRTVDVLKATDDTLAQITDLSGFQQSGGCDESAQQEQQPPPCTSAKDGWASLHESEDALTGTSPTFGSDPLEDEAWTTVLASGTECPEDPPGLSAAAKGHCPLTWNGTQKEDDTDRHDWMRVRVVAFGTNATREATLEVKDLSVAPIGVSASPRQSTAGFPIPEEAPKAVPMEAETMGAIGTTIEPDVQQPEGWNVALDGLPETNAIEASTSPRLLVTAPISPSGVAQSAVLNPELRVPADPIRSVRTLVPIGVNAGEHPDLVVEEVKVADDLKRGEETLVQVSVKNTGFQQSDPVEVTGVARYDDGTVNIFQAPGDAEAVHLDPLPPGVSDTVVLTWTPSQAGNTTARVGVDLTRPEPLSGPTVEAWGGGEVPELNECGDPGCNNVGTARTFVEPPKQADTSVNARVLADLPLIVGEPVEVEVSVHNAGPATVPAFDVRLLAGVISLLEDDPLRVTEPLEAGETWSTRVELIPGFGGDLDLVARAVADEALVRELRGLKAGGGTFDEDNTQVLQLPVISEGLSISAPGAVDGSTIMDDGILQVPVHLTNLGTDPLDVSAAAEAEGGIGTLVDEQGAPIGTIELASGESRNATLHVFYEHMPPAGRQPVSIDAVSDAGLESTVVEAEVPEDVGFRIRPVVETATTGNVALPVQVTSTGNAPVDARVTIDAPHISRQTRIVELEPGSTSTVPMDAWLGPAMPDRVEGQITVRAGNVTERAPLRIMQEGDVVPTIEDADTEGGTMPHTWARVGNLGTTPGEFTLSLVQGNQTLATSDLRVRGESSQNVSFDVVPKPGLAQLQLADASGEMRLNWTLDVPNLTPDIRVLHTRLDPVAPDDGESVTVQATIANEGATPATLRPGLFVDGVLHTLTPGEVTIDPGSVENVVFQWTAESGDHTVTVSADPQDRMDDADDSDNARATDVEIQAGSGTDSLNEAPFLQALAAIVVLTSVAWLRRDRTG